MGTVARQRDPKSELLTKASPTKYRDDPSPGSMDDGRQGRRPNAAFIRASGADGVDDGWASTLAVRVGAKNVDVDGFFFPRGRAAGAGAKPVSSWFAGGWAPEPPRPSQEVNLVRWTWTLAAPLALPLALMAASPRRCH